MSTELQAFRVTTNPVPAVLMVGLVSLGTGGGRAPMGVIAACISVGTNCGGVVREGEVQG